VETLPRDLRLEQICSAVRTAQPRLQSVLSPQTLARRGVTALLQSTKLPQKSHIVTMAQAFENPVEVQVLSSAYCLQPRFRGADVVRRREGIPCVGDMRTVVRETLVSLPHEREPLAGRIGYGRGR